jgi:hypothetical protein
MVADGVGYSWSGLSRSRRVANRRTTPNDAASGIAINNQLLRCPSFHEGGGRI